MAPVDTVLERLTAVKRSGDSGHQWMAICPAHDDNQQSLAIGAGSDGKVLLKCYVGCSFASIVRSLNLEMTDLFPEDDARKPERVTVGRLAFDKRLPSEFLRNECGLADDDGKVTIPYYGEDKKRIATKDRKALSAKDGSFWPRGMALAAYGLWRLADARAAGFVVIVEGESDCWTLWLHGVPAIGIPGASATKIVTLAILEGVSKLYVWREPDAGGKEFAAGIARQLDVLAYKGERFILQADAVKDPNALHQRDLDGFDAAWAAIVAGAKPLPSAKEFGEQAAKDKDAPKKKRERRALHVPGRIEATADETRVIPPASPGYYGLTDLGNAQRLIFRHGRDIRFCHTWDKWLIWDSARWRPDMTGDIYRKATDTIASIYAESQSGDVAPEKRQQILEHAIRSEESPRITAMVRVAKNEKSVPVLPESLDTHPWLFNCLSGTVDLTNGNHRPHCRENHLTKIASVNYDADAKCPTWEAVLHKIMGGSASLVHYLQLAVGYSLTGDVSEKCFFFLFGSGNNGKSTLVEVLADLLGDYWMKTTAETVLSKDRSSSIPNDVARLVGIRMVSTAELPEGRQIDEARVKDLTGRDTISARFMRAEWFDFRPIFKLWMYGNHKPTIKGADNAIWERVRLIPFSVTIPKCEQDEQLPMKLRAELPGILNWAIRGCLEWQKCGLPVPLEVREATDDYRAEMDLIESFLVEKCVANPTVSEAGIQVSALYRLYESWCKQNGESPPSQRVFSGKLKHKGYSQSQGSKGVRRWNGIMPESEAPRTAARNGHGSSPFSAYDEEAIPQ